MLKITPKFMMSMLAAPMALAGLAVPAAAQDDRPRAEIPYGDLDLASSEGRAQLQKRVDSAIAQMCGTRTSHRQTLRQTLQSMKCRDEARRDAEVKVASLLTDRATRVAAQDVRHLSAR